MISFFPAWAGASSRPVRRCHNLLRALSAVLAVSLAGLAGCASGPSQQAPAPSTATTPAHQAADRLTDLVLAQAMQRRPTAAGDAAQPLRVSVSASTALAGPDRPPTSGALPVPQWIVERLAAQLPSPVVVPDGDASARFRLKARIDTTDETASPAALVLTVEALDGRDGSLLVAASERVVDASLMALLPRQPAERASAPAPVVTDSLQALNAEYVALLKAGRDVEAQAVFKRIVAEGLATRNLTMRLLFAPASSAFYPDPVLVRRYGSWLSELADQLQNTTQCLEIVGHASRTGTEAANRRLSGQRAQAVRQILIKHAPSLAPRLSTVALGREQTRTSAASDDQRDVLDRRVELRVVDCP